MPVIKSAIKKYRRDKKKEKENFLQRKTLEAAVKKAEKVPNDANISLAFSNLDKAVKNKLIHLNKAARIKAKISKKISSKKIEKTTSKKPVTKAKPAPKTSKTKKTKK